MVIYALIDIVYVHWVGEGDLCFKWHRMQSLFFYYRAKQFAAAVCV